MRKVYAGMMVLAVVLFVGTAGAVDHDEITLAQAGWQTAGALVMFLAGRMLMKANERRHHVTK